MLFRSSKLFDMSGICYSANFVNPHFQKMLEELERECAETAASPPDMVKTVGGTTFDIYFHFSQTSRETFTDKVLRLIQPDTVTSEK